MSESQPTDLDVEVVEHENGGWVVIGNTAGERKQFGDVHASKDEAEHYARHMFAGADRWTGAAQEVAPDPIKYPDDKPSPDDKPQS